jgi:hypothetical protein
MFRCLLRTANLGRCIVKCANVDQALFSTSSYVSKIGSNDFKFVEKVRYLLKCFWRRFLIILDQKVELFYYIFGQ